MSPAHPFLYERTGDWLVDEIHLAFGGVAAKTVMAPKTEELLTEKSWNEDNLNAALETLKEDICISPDAPGKACPCAMLHGSSSTILRVSVSLARCTSHGIATTK